MSINDLPQELVDHIIDFFHNDDRGSLKACSLTCRQWKLSAQYHLFSIIYLKTTSQFTTISAITRTFPFQFIQHLFISNKNTIGCKIVESPYWPLFRNVKQLSLLFFQVQVKSGYPQGFETLFEHFTSVQRLFIGSSRFSSLNKLICSIRSFPRLEYLSVQDVQWASNQVDDKSEGNRLHLRELQLEKMDQDPFLEALFKICPESGLHNFRTDTCAQACRVVQRCINLRQLWLFDFSQLQVDSLGLRAHHHVEEIRFQTFLKISSVSSWFPKILDTIGSKCVRKISFKILYDLSENPEDTLWSIRWDRIDVALSSSKYNKLEKLTVEFFVSGSSIVHREDLESELERVLPRLAARGVLEAAMS